MHAADLFIHPDLHGQGYGRRIIQCVAGLAKEQDRLRVEWANKFDNPARGLYDEVAECSFVEYLLKGSS
jgi:GNAT superfamily N-acetyltransferase